MIPSRCQRVKAPRGSRPDVEPTSKSCGFLLDNIGSRDQRRRPQKSSKGRENKIAFSGAFLAAGNQLLLWENPAVVLKPEGMLSCAAPMDFAGLGSVSQQGKGSRLAGAAGR